MAEAVVSIKVVNELLGLWLTILKWRDYRAEQQAKRLAEQRRVAARTRFRRNLGFAFCWCLAIAAVGSVIYVEARSA